MELFPSLSLLWRQVAGDLGTAFLVSEWRLSFCQLWALVLTLSFYLWADCCPPDNMSKQPFWVLKFRNLFISDFQAPGGTQQVWNTQ